MSSVFNGDGGPSVEAPNEPFDRLHKQRRESLVRREQFLNTVVHDLKTPLTSVKGYAQLAERRLDRGQYDAVRQALHVIDREVNKMARMLQMALDAGRIESGRASLQLTELDLNSLIAEVVDGAQSVRNRPVDCLLPDTPTVGSWDRKQLATALGHVLDNALAYSPSDSRVIVSLRRVDDPAAPRDERQQVEITVQDQGIGIPADELERVFDRFYRSPNAAGVEGMGLGLYVARGLIALHHGRIWAHSPGPGLGTTVYICLPLRPRTGVDA